MNQKNAGLSILGGALLGAAAMYLLDPEAGDRRRHAIGAKAGDTLRGTGDRLGDAWSHAHKLGADLIGHAQDIGSHLADRASASAADASDQAAGARDQAASGLKALQDRIADLGQELIGRARQAAGKARTSVDQAHQSAMESTHPLRHRLARAIDPDHDHPLGHATAYASAGVGAVAVGAAAMYFMDPDKGRDRRDFVANQVSKCVRETGHVCRLTGQYVMRLWRGRAAGAAPNLPPADPYAGEELVQRVRAEISGLMANPAQIQLMADANGIVTLYGKVPASEHEAVMFTIPRVPGVRAVVDHLDGPAAPSNNAEPSTIGAAPQM